LAGPVPGPDIALSGWTALKNGDMELTMASGAVFHLGATALTRIRLDCGDSCDRYTSRREQASISNFKARNGVSHASALRNFAIIEQKERLTWN
jgi:hypothetical protein